MPPRKHVDPIAERFGAIIRTLRHQRGWTLADVARRANMSVAYVGYVERGENMPTLKVVLDLADVLDVDAGELLKKVVIRRKASLDEII